ncbi:MT-A70-like protein, partial [Pilobolus umbonatus]
LIVMDPPWPNKSVHRSSHYETHDIYDLFKIPIPDMLSEGGIIAIWVTNKPKYRQFILNKLFPSWQIECIAEWTWLKVTTKGECISPLNSPHKKPYEQLIIGRSKTDNTHLIQLPVQHTLVSVPSVHHSRKPPLFDAFSPYLPSHPKCLELFARCLMPGWISWGNECIRFQHINYYEKEPSEMIE